MSKELRILKRDRGVIFLETALVMPIFMIFLCMVVDIPRLLSAKQKLPGASRLVSEIMARNNGNQKLNMEDLKPYFFESSGDSNVVLSVSKQTKKSTLGSIGSILTKWGTFGKVVNFLGNFISGGNFDPYFENVFERDKFYGATVSADIPTILSSDFYSAMTGNQGPATTIQGQTVYMPNADSCKNTGTSFISKMLTWLHDHFGI